VTYNLSGANTASGQTASLTMSGGSGTFSTPTLASSGSTTITIDSIQSGSCASSTPGNNTATVPVNQPPTPVNPSSTSVNIGNPAVFGPVTATSGTSPTYQWEVSTNSGTTWSPVNGGTGVNNGTDGTGGTTATFTTVNTTALMSGNEYECVVSVADCASATTAAATLTVVPNGYLLVTLPGQTYTSGSGNSGTVSSQTAGAPFDIVITAVTNDLVTINTNYDGTNTILFTGPGGSPTYPVSVFFTNGQATNVPITLTLAQTATLNAVDVTNGYAAIASSSLVVNPGATTQYEVSAATPQTAGTAFNVTVAALDAFGNTNTTDSSTPVTLGSSTGSPTFSVNPQTLSAGLFTVSATDDVAENMTITATDGNGTNGVSSSITVRPAALNHFAISAITSPQTAGTPITGVTLTAQDVYNNTATNFTGTVAYSGTAGVTGTSVAFTAGVLSGASVTPTVAGSSETLVVTGSGDTGTATFNVIPGAVSAAQSVISANPTSVTAGGSSTITVTEKDANGNQENPANGGVEVAPVLSVPSPSSLGTLTDNGNGTFTASLTTSTSTANSPVVVSGTINSVAIGTTASVALTPGTVDHYVVTASSPQTRTAAFTVTVTAKDANGNTVTGDNSDSVTLSGMGNATAAVNPKTLSSGVQTFSVTDNTAQTITITATDGNSKTGTSSSIVVYPLPYYSSTASGDWNAAATWLVSSNGGTTWSAASTAPELSGIVADEVFITNSTSGDTALTVTVNASVTVSNVIVYAGNTLAANGATLTVGANTGTTNLYVLGTLQIANATSSALAGGTTTALQFGNGGEFDYKLAGAPAVPTATWDTGSTCLLEPASYSAAVTATGISGQSFYNLTITNPASGDRLEMGVTGTVTMVSGTLNLYVPNTASDSIALFHATNSTLTVSNLTINTGTGAASTKVLLADAATDTNETLNISGNLSVTGQIDGFGGASETLVLNGTGNNQTVAVPQSPYFITTNVVSMQVNSNAVATLDSPIPGINAFTVENGGTLNCGTNTISAPTTFTLASGGTLGVGSATGVPGNITATSPTLSSGANYTFNGTNAQVVGTFTTTPTAATVNNLTIANTADPVQLSQTVTATNMAVNNLATLDFNTHSVTNVNPPTLAGGLKMEVTKTGADTFTGSKLTLSSGTLTYGGSLTVTTNGVSSALVLNDSIPLFVSSGGSSGSFSSVTLPTSPTGLEWNSGASPNEPVSGDYTLDCNGTLANAINSPSTVVAGVGQSATFTAAGSSGSGSGYTYAWTGPNSFTANTATITLNSLTRGMGGSYVATVTDSVGCTAMATATLTYTNSPPVVTPVTVTHYAGGAVKVPLSTLLAAGSSPDGDSVSLTAVASTTVGGVPLTLNGGSVGSSTMVYVPAATTNGDTFTFTITDNYDGSNTVGTVTVNVVASVGQTNAPVILTSSNATISFYGIPGTNYDVQRATNLTAPIGWVDLGTTNAPATGAFQVIDNFNDLNPPNVAPPAAYYQLLVNP
jgi:hypothetical protein